MDGDAAARAGLRAAQREHRDEIAARWQEALIPAGLVPHSGGTVSRHLRVLTERMSALLLAEPFAPEAARALGTALVRLGYGQPAALGRTLEVLGNTLMTGLSVTNRAALQPRLVALLGELAAGFAEESRAAILATQGHLRDAQLTALAETRAALRASEVRLHSVATNAPVILFALDRAGVVTFIAGRGLVAVGRSARELIGRTLLVGLGAAPQVPGYVRRALAGEAFSTPVAVNEGSFGERENIVR